MSANVMVLDYLGAKCIKCSSCGYDERDMYEVFPEEKTSQKEKANFSPYKAGGHDRVKK